MLKLENYRAQTPQNLAFTKILQHLRKTSTIPGVDSSFGCFIACVQWIVWRLSYFRVKLLPDQMFLFSLYLRNIGFLNLNKKWQWEQRITKSEKIVKLIQSVGRKVLVPKIFLEIGSRSMSALVAEQLASPISGQDAKLERKNERHFVWMH